MQWWRSNLHEILSQLSRGDGGETIARGRSIEDSVLIAQTGVFPLRRC